MVVRLGLSQNAKPINCHTSGIKYVCICVADDILGSLKQDKVFVFQWGGGQPHHQACYNI